MLYNLFNFILGTFIVTDVSGSAWIGDKGDLTGGEFALFDEG